MELTQLPDGTITGTIHGTRGTVTTVSGRIDGNFIHLTRKMGSNEQYYNVALSSDGQNLNGNLSGVRDVMAGTDFKAKRE
jgi:hypothetical protein